MPSETEKETNEEQITPKVQHGYGNSRENRKPEHYPNGGKPSREESALLSERALRLRMMGATYGDIAKACGYSNISSARSAVKRAMENEHSEDAKQARELELRRLDRLLMALWPKLVAETSADGENNTLTFGEWMQLLDRYFKLSKARADLMGLDAPTEIDISHYVRQRAEAEGLSYEDVMSEVDHIMSAAEAGS